MTDTAETGSRPSGPPDGAGAAPPDEFAGIPGPRRSRHPVLAAAAVALAAFLAWQVRDDLIYALSSSSVRDLGEARTLAAGSVDALPFNRYVRLRGLADRESAVILDTQGSWQFTQMFRLLGTDGRVFVRRVADPLPAELAERDVFTGRLIRFRDLSFQESIRRHFAAHVSATRLFRPDALAAALRAGGPLSLVDLAGVKVTLAPGDELAVDHLRPGEVRIELPRERFPDGPAARAAVEARGGTVVEASSAADRHTIIASFPADRWDAALSELADLDRRVRIAPARRTLKARAAEVAVGAQGLVVGGRELPLAEIPIVRMHAALQVPADAVLLVEGDRPRDHLKIVLVVAALVAFAAINLLALRRA